MHTVMTQTHDVKLACILPRNGLPSVSLCTDVELPPSASLYTGWWARAQDPTGQQALHSLAGIELVFLPRRLAVWPFAGAQVTGSGITK